MADVSIERTFEAAASPGAVWERCYADPRVWPEWNTELASVSPEGPFTLGATARVKFKTGLRLRFRIVELERGRLFTDEARLPGARMGHRHVLEPTAGGVRLRNTIYFAGPLASLWARAARTRATRAIEDGQRNAAALAIRART